MSCVWLHTLDCKCCLIYQTYPEHKHISLAVAYYYFSLGFFSCILLKSLVRRLYNAVRMVIKLSYKEILSKQVLTSFYKFGDCNSPGVFPLCSVYMFLRDTDMCALPMSFILKIALVTHNIAVALVTDFFPF